MAEEQRAAQNVPFCSQMNAIIPGQEGRA